MHDSEIKKTGIAKLQRLYKIGILWFDKNTKGETKKQMKTKKETGLFDGYPASFVFY